MNNTCLDIFLTMLARIMLILQKYHHIVIKDSLLMHAFS